MSLGTSRLQALPCATSEHRWYGTRHASSIRSTRPATARSMYKKLVGVRLSKMRPPPPTKHVLLSRNHALCISRRGQTLELSLLAKRGRQEPQVGAVSLSTRHPQQGVDYDCCTYLLCRKLGTTCTECRQDTPTQQSYLYIYAPVADPNLERDSNENVWTRLGFTTLRVVFLFAFRRRSAGFTKGRWSGGGGGGGAKRMHARFR